MSKTFANLQWIQVAPDHTCKNWWDKNLPFHEEQDNPPQLIARRSPWYIPPKGE